MTLAKVFRVVRPSIVAFISNLTKVDEVDEEPQFPPIVGTGFVVDSRGVVATNRHIIESLQSLLDHPVTGVPSAGALLFTDPRQTDAGTVAGVVRVPIVGYNCVDCFSIDTPWYGESVPDMGFVHLKVCGLPALRLADRPGIWETGITAATSGFPLGNAPILYHGRITQVGPLLRRGLVSSVFPFPCPQPCGFTLDVLQDRGASGSPVFFEHDPEVIGMLDMGYPNFNITSAIPSYLVKRAVTEHLAQNEALLCDLPDLQSYVDTMPKDFRLTWERLPPTAPQDVP